MIAADLRTQILSGEIADGSILPKQEDLIRRYNVSLPSIREAMRILETEGLVTVVRGNVGGAIAHTPQVGGVAYMLGLVLQARRTPLGEVAAALREIEPVCVALCASRPDRREVVVPQLRRAQEAAVHALGNGEEYVRHGRLFHEALVAGCGNQVLILIAGALEAIWSVQEKHWAQRALRRGNFPYQDLPVESVEPHERLIGLIEEGDAEAARSYAQEHLSRSQRYALGDAGSDKLVDVQQAMTLPQAAQLMNRARERGRA
jgi:DNA-binding FadR family transcriptional regulator